MAVRLACCVPFCRRTRGDRKNSPVTEGMEWLCADHWPLVSRRTKAFRRAADAELAKAQAICDAIELEGFECAKIHGGVTHYIMDRFRPADNRRRKARRRSWRAWERCKREAIERGMGI